MMQFPNLDEEDVDFSVGAAGRSRLSSLFHNESSASGDVNQALTFTAPKQPKKNDGAQSGPGALKLIHAVAVHAYHLIDGNYANQGKLGCAILGQHETFTYKILLYKGKQVQVTFCTISPSFIFHVQPNNYANFYDDKKENWSLNFDSESAITEFAKQLALAKANTQGKVPNSLIIQDLAIGEGPSLEQSDSAEVKYTGWLVQNCAIGQVFDSNMNAETNFRVRLGKGKVIKGWNDGLIGCQKGSKRLLVIPPSLAYGAEGMGSAVPSNSTLLFLIHVLKVKVSRDSSHSPSPVKPAENLVEKKPDVPPRHSFSQEDNIRMRGASISEQLSQSPKKDKAQLISRMAKMGTATLPLQGAIPAQVSSESENEEEIPVDPPVIITSVSNSRTSSPKAFSKPRSRANSGNTSIAAVQSAQPQPLPATGNAPFHVSQHSSQVSLYAQAAMPFQQPFVPPTTTLSAFPQIPGQFGIPQSQYSLQNIPGMIPSIPSSMADAHLPLLITETRSQNSEVRLSLAKITDKVDSVLQKVDDLRSQGMSSGSAHVPFMESVILVQNIERIVQENNRLKEDVEVKNNNIQTLNEKICDLFQRNQRFFEESSSMLEQRSDSLHAASAQSQAKIINLEQEKLKLSSELSEATAKLTSFESVLQKHQAKETELQQRILEIERESKMKENLLNDTKEQKNEDESVMNSLRNELKNVKHEKRLLTTKLESLEEKFSELRETKESLEKTLEEHQKKLREIKSKAEDELAQLKMSHEKEIEIYEEKLKRKPSLTNLETVSAIQDSESTSLKKEMEVILKEKDEIQLKYQDLYKKLLEFEKSETSYREKLQELQVELENSSVWKKKYEVFYEKTKALKERYENQIIELMTEVKQLQAMRSHTTNPDFSAEIKRVMNMLYKLLQGKFDSQESYAGSKVLEMTLQAIRGLTLQMLEMKQRAASDSSESTSDMGKSTGASLQSDLENVKSPSQDEKKSTSDTVLPQPNGIDEKNISGSAENSATESNVSILQESMNSESKHREGHLETGKMENGLLENSDSDETIPAISDELQNKLGSGTNSLSKSADAKEKESDKRDSPEKNASSNGPFDESLSETEKSKIWRPQPPPLFDDDDEDEDDDDWLK